MRLGSRLHCLAVALFIGLSALLSFPPSADAAGPRAYPDGKLPADRRLGDLKDLNGYFPFTPPADREAWDKRAEQVRRQILVATGLWPIPERTAPNAVIHGKVERDGYTVERVYFESYPGFYVTGSLFRPTGKTGRLPGVLCPHGHWTNGRFYDSGRQDVRKQIVQGAERFEVGGRYPLQARCVQLARMGCVVFHYDMLGYADSNQISYELAHRFRTQRPEMNQPDAWGLFSPQAELRLQSVLGLQTYNSLRALDWLSELPDVDPQRIAVTGASGGGTQTMLLSAIDPRVAVSFPAVMVSTAMQGGCTCENCDYLRINTGNIEFAAMFAPKPLGMTAADDWTKELATKGLPELKRHFATLGKPDNVTAALLTHFKHNYNYVSRAAMYSWLNKHLKLGFEDPIVEEDFKPLSVAELTVWDDAHPQPPSGEEFERKLLKQIAEASDHQLRALASSDKRREVVGGAVEVMIGRTLPEAGAIEHKLVSERDRGDYLEFASILRHAGVGEELPTVFLHPKQWNKQVAVWVHTDGKSSLFNSAGEPADGVRELLAAGTAVAGVDLLYQGEFLADGKPLEAARRVKNEREFAGYTYGYNHPLFAQRVHDILSVISYIKHDQQHPTEKIHLVGAAGGGRWAAFAKVLAGDAIDRTAIDAAGFRFADLNSITHPDLLPGAVKYGDLAGVLGLIPKDGLLVASPEQGARGLVEWVLRKGEE
jgi:dienelactone hydrolase